jgi:hypothetical protein
MIESNSKNQLNLLDFQNFPIVNIEEAEEELDTLIDCGEMTDKEIPTSILEAIDKSHQQKEEVEVVEPYWNRY